jgi:L-threonylcarbamoyladenylate synthase
VDLILDGGETRQGIESTIVGLRANGGWALLRPGPITPEAIAQVLGEGRSRAPRKGIEAPGQLASHYAPGKPVRLNATDAQADEFLIGLGAIAGDVNLSPAAIWPKRQRGSMPASTPAPMPPAPHRRGPVPDDARPSEGNRDCQRQSRARRRESDPVPCLHAQPAGSPPARG